MIRTVEGVELDLGDLQILPGMVNAHDHLEFALFPRLGRGPYPDAAAWARDIYHPECSPIRDHLRVPKRLRLLWGGFRNLIAGVTTVSHHNPYEEIFDIDFPVRVVKHYGWSHSFAFARDLAASIRATPPGAPFVIHLAEGTNPESAAEVFRLHEMGALDERTVLVHCTGLDERGWGLVSRARASVIWCPRSNHYTLERTLSLDSIPPDIRVALGTDSSLTTNGDFLDEIAFVHRLGVSFESTQEMVTRRAHAVFRLPETPEDWIASRAFAHPPELVVIGGRIHLISESLARQAPTSFRRCFYPLHVESRRPVLVRWNTPQLLQETRRHLGTSIRLGGREVAA